MTIDIADIIAAVVVNLVGSGLLGKYLLQRHQTDHEKKLARLKTDLEGEIRTLQTALDRTVFVHRAQFEVEFDALKEAWAKISRLRAALCSLRPISSVVPVDDPTEQKLVRLQRRLVALGEARDAALVAVDDRSPFYPHDIHRAFATLLQIAGNELTEVQIEKPFDGDWFDRGKEHREEFLAQTDKVADLIRKRLESLSIYRQE